MLFLKGDQYSIRLTDRYHVIDIAFGNKDKESILFYLDILQVTA